MKRTHINMGLLLMVALALGLLGFAPSTGVTTDPEISSIISDVDSNRILNTATTLQNFGTRQSCSDQPQPGRGGDGRARLPLQSIQRHSRTSGQA